MIAPYAPFLYSSIPIPMFQSLYHWTAAAVTENLIFAFSGLKMNTALMSVVLNEIKHYVVQ
jgi:hypothetical protein